jgi:hypothetical protein
MAAANRWYLLAAYAGSRVLVFAAMGVVALLELGGARCGYDVPRPIEGFDGLARCWDARWFLRTAAEGYPATLPADGVQSTLAFLPGYPGLVAAGSAVGLPPLVAAIGVSVVAGAVATLLVAALAREVADDDTATRAALLFCFFPGAVVLSWAYSEALAAALAGACLVLLHRRRWVPAGLAAAAAGATRADVGLGLFVAAAIAAVLAVRRDGDRWALAAPLLAPLGLAGFWTYLAWRTGSPSAWLIAQDRGWDQHMDFGTHAVRTVGRIVTDPVGSPTRVIQAVTLVLLVAGLVCLFARPRRFPLPWLAYTAVLVVIMLASNQVGFRPRAMLPLLPLVVAAAVRLPRGWTPWAVGAFAVAQALLVVMYLGVPLIFPP